MITEDLTDVGEDTLLDDDDDVEDIGEIDLDSEEFVEEEEEVSAAPVRRSRPASAPAAAEEGEEMWLRGLMIATTVVLILIMPLTFAISSGELSGIAKSVAGIFTNLGS